MFCFVLIGYREIKKVNFIIQCSFSCVVTWQTCVEIQGKVEASVLYKTEENVTTVTFCTEEVFCFRRMLLAFEKASETMW